MVQGYYTLDESADILGIAAEELKQLARKGEIRSFQDRGTWRFRIQDIQEMARQRGRGSDPELPLGESPAPKPTDSPAPRSPRPQHKQSDDVFAFSLDPEKGEDDGGVNLGADAASADAKGGKSSKKGNSKNKLVAAGSDSDVRLVADSSDVTFTVPEDSDVKVVGQDQGPKSGPRSGTAGPKSPKPSKLQPPGPAAGDPLDSGVRLVPLDSDSDVRIVGAGSDEFDAALGATPPKGATDSDIRLEGQFPPARSGEGLLTEEINLDEELKKDEAERKSQILQAKMRPKEPEFPTTSPFELSEADLDLEPPTPASAPRTPRPKAQAKEDSSDFELTPVKEPSSDFELTPAKDEDRSSDFDLTPAAESSSPLELGSSDDFRLEVPDEDEEITLADDGSVNLKGPSSGINLNKPADSGISLEEGGESSEEIEFSLTLDAESTPKPSTPKPAPSPALTDSDSEFELSLDVDNNQKSDSDSEFELTLDDAGALEEIEEDVAPEPAKGERDIFETEFEVPGLEEDSGSDAVAVEDADTNLESSDFEITGLSEEDAAAEVDESGSMVVPLDEEEAVDDAAETMTAKSRQKKPTKASKPARPQKKTKSRPAPVDAEADADDFADLDPATPLAEEDAEAEADLDDEPLVAEERGSGKPRVIRETVVVQQAPWGVFPTLVLFPCVVIMVLLGIMGFELVQQQQYGYKPGFLTKTMSGLIGDNKK